MHEFTERESKLPIDERYMHAVVARASSDGRPPYQFVITGLPALIKRIHHTKVIAADYSFKKTHGSMDDWDVSGFDDAVEMRASTAYQPL